MAGTFRLITNQSHTRFEGTGKNQRKTYFGAGHPNAQSSSGDLITLSDEELNKFKNPRERLRLLEGNWSRELLHAIALETEVIDKPDPVEILLSNTSEVVVGELNGLDVPELTKVLKAENSRAARKDIVSACKKLIDELTDPPKVAARK